MTCLEKFKLEHPSEANALWELRTCEECWNSQIKEETNVK